MPAPSPSWAPTPEDRRGIGEAGGALLDRVLETYDPTCVEGMQLLEAARAADVLATLRGAEKRDLRQERLWSAYFTATIRMLGLT